LVMKYRESLWLFGRNNYHSKDFRHSCALLVMN
jgi:hypothetical protein